MYPFYPPYQTHQQYYPQYMIQQQLHPWFNEPYIPQSITPPQAFIKPQNSLPPSTFVNPDDSTIDKDPKTISNCELIDLLNDHINELKQLQDKDQQQVLTFIDDITMLIHVQKPVLLSAVQHEFFSILQISFIDILRQWRRLSSLSDDQSFMLRSMVKLIKRIIKATGSVHLLPAWLSDSILFEAIGDCLTDIANSGKFLDHRNKYQLKHFTRLIDVYMKFQQRLTDENQSNKDILLPLLHPILQCLTSSHFINTFTNISADTKSMTTIEKFFLIKCPAFIISYNGSRLEQTMKNLLSTMLPQYVTLLNKLVPSARNWSQSVIRCVQYLLKTTNHGANQFPINAKLVSSHLPLIDHVLKLLDEPIFYNNLSETLSNAETSFVHIAISFLVNMISEPEILAHIKQSQVTRIFLRLTSCEYEPLVFNVYTLLAYTTHEEDIKAMKKPGRLLSTIIKSLKTTLDQTPNDENHIEQLLETLKGLVQHDQMKDEVIKQNALPFLLECSQNSTGRSHILTFEILWSLTFHEEGLLALRSNQNFLDKIQTIPKDGNNEPLKKAADGLIWKLIREPSFLEKIAKQEAEEKNATPELMETVIEEIVNNDGQKQLVTTIKPSIDVSSERIFQYDIMISYCHADKELTYKIHKFLVDQGLKVWIDLDNMYGPAMSAMADAVENSEFVIMCMSDSYKQSTYCQAEAEYAFNCKRRLIPLIMRQGYRPDGWLGFMIGSRIYVDFGRFDFDVACEKLMTEISLQRKQPLPSKQVSINPHEKPTVTISNIQHIPAPRRENPLLIHSNNILSTHMNRKPKSNFTEKRMKEWTESDVLDFLFTHGLFQLMPLCETMNGRSLIQLYKMCISRSSKVYVLLDNELKSSYRIKLPIGIYTRFLSVMEERTTASPLASLRTVAIIPVTAVTTIPQPYTSHTSSKPIDTNAPFPHPTYASRKPVITNVPFPYPTHTSRKAVNTNVPYEYPVHATRKPVNTDVPYEYPVHATRKPVNTDVPYEYPVHATRKPVNTNVPFQYPSHPDKPYDLFITSDAPALEILRAVQRYDPNIKKLASIQTQNSVRF